MRKNASRKLAVFLFVFMLSFIWTPVIVNADMITGGELLYNLWQRTWPFIVGLVAVAVILTVLLIRRNFRRKRGS
ncbi:MAG TPA: hypothetical protein PK369_04335 [Thermoclostridium sp.]|nr:hypothetical protein [Clostridiaceae bacterium]HOQ75784.1 hypothetical protein [Thermoclostridium sp.]HPU45437.1 hypothetical protein [Thermoclostridium sp.]